MTQCVSTRADTQSQASRWYDTVLVYWTHDTHWAVLTERGVDVAASAGVTPAIFREMVKVLPMTKIVLVE